MGYRPNTGGQGASSHQELGGNSSADCHPMNAISGLESALAGKAAANVVTLHEAANDPHPMYLTKAEADALYAVAAHNHDAAYAALSHGHAISNVTGLQTALDGKASTGHNHDASYSVIGHAHAGVYEPANANIQAHVAQAHAPADAQKNADITKAEIEAKLTGQISSHSHAGGSSPFVFEGTLAADVPTGANQTPVTVTGLVFSFSANKNYVFEVFGTISSAAATTGCGLQIDVSAAVTQVAMTFFHQLANAGTLTGGNSIADDASAGVSSGINANGAIVPFYASGILRAGANGGTAQLRYRSEVNAVTTIKAGTIMRVRELP